MIKAISNFLNVIAVVLRGRGQNDLADLVRAGSVFVREGEEASVEFERITREIDAMVAAGRDPTPEEIRLVKDNRSKLHDEIQSVDLSDPVEPVPAADPVPEDPANG